MRMERPSYALRATQDLPVRVAMSRVNRESSGMDDFREPEKTSPLSSIRDFRFPCYNSR
jgi:hypothetical protein